jgi:hypothetical protein
MKGAHVIRRNIKLISKPIQGEVFRQSMITGAETAA